MKGERVIDLKVGIRRGKDESDWGNRKHARSFFQPVYGGDLKLIALAITAAISISLMGPSAHSTRRRRYDAATPQSGAVSALPSIHLSGAEAATNLNRCPTSSAHRLKRETPWRNPLQSVTAIRRPDLDDLCTSSGPSYPQHVVEDPDLASTKGAIPAHGPHACAIRRRHIAQPGPGTRCASIRDNALRTLDQQSATTAACHRAIGASENRIPGMLAAGQPSGTNNRGQPIN